MVKRMETIEGDCEDRKFSERFQDGSHCREERASFLA
jgi:hypothetical protein